MEPLLMRAVIFITLALLLYTIGVWSERIQGRLKRWHLVLFYLGLICDALGTHFMSKLSNSSLFTLHGVTGLLAITLMFIHAIWASIVLIRNDETKIIQFHKFSIIVWIIWLIPYFIGMFLGMGS